MRRWAAAAVAGSALFTVAGCGGGDSAAQPQPSASSAAPAPQEPAKAQPLTGMDAVVAAMGQACAKEAGEANGMSFAAGTAGVQERLCTDEGNGAQAVAWVWEDSTSFEAEWRKRVSEELAGRAVGKYRSCAVLATSAASNWGVLYGDLDEVEVSPDIKAQVEAGFATELPEPGSCTK